MAVVDQDLVPLGEAVRRLRKVRGMTREYLSGLTELHRNHIGGVERGERNITIKTVLALAQALEVPPADLLAGYGPAPKIGKSHVQKPSLLVERSLCLAFLLVLGEKFVGNGAEGVFRHGQFCSLFLLRCGAGIGSGSKQRLRLVTSLSRGGQRNSRVRPKCKRLLLAPEAVGEPP